MKKGMKQMQRRMAAPMFVGICILASSGCVFDSFRSPTADYKGEYCRDVSVLPDPAEPAKPDPGPTFANSVVGQYAATQCESPERLLSQADGYFTQGRYYDSARLYRKYLATPAAQTASPETLATAYYRIGCLSSKQLDYAKAKEEFTTALKYAPQNAECRRELGKAQYNLTEYAAADATFAALLNENPGDEEARRYYGLTLLEGSRRAEAPAMLAPVVGELEATALLADKYYEIGDQTNAAVVEARLAQVAAQSGKSAPTLRHKPRTSQIVAPTQTTPAAESVQVAAASAVPSAQVASVAVPTPEKTPSVVEEPQIAVAPAVPSAQVAPVAAPAPETPSIVEAPQIAESAPVVAPTPVASAPVAVPAPETPSVVEEPQIAKSVPAAAPTQIAPVVATAPAAQPSQVAPVAATAPVAARKFSSLLTPRVAAETLAPNDVANVSDETQTAETAPASELLTEALKSTLARSPRKAAPAEE
ncbi:MAG: tetratricopeptide repeat protein, partial [Thermoguttaceae bacterium]|nr:tetratricopeptide repeat protein [Thermoguttaceae bacterium]